MITIIIVLVAIAAVFFCAALAFRAYNRPKWEKEQTKQQAQRQKFFENWRKDLRERFRLGKK